MQTPPAWCGRWRIVETELWDADFLDMDGPAHVGFEAEAIGWLQFGMVKGDLDCRFSTRDGRPLVEFTWEGADEGEHVCGRGWALLSHDDKLHGRIFMHCGDDSSFTASREAPPAQPRRRAKR